MIQSFLKEDLLDELIITTLPVVLGDGTPLFGKQQGTLEFELGHSEILLNAMVKNSYKRKR